MAAAAAGEHVSEERLRVLTARLLSPAAQAKELAELPEEPLRLSDAQVAQVFKDHVNGVASFKYRGQASQPSLNFMVSAYREGLVAFQGTNLHNHLLWSMRYVVHKGYDRDVDCATQLREVAIAFKDCQAVQARAIERAGHQLRGGVADLPAHLLRLVGEYKVLAIQALAADRLAKGLASDHDPEPTHYLNRLTADLGEALGLNADDVRRAELDGHATARFARLMGTDLQAAAARCRELFDARPLLGAFVSEAGSFDEHSPPESLPAAFLRWSAGHLREPHLVLDAATATRVFVDQHFALCLFEHLFAGGVRGAPGESFRGLPVCDLFTVSWTSESHGAPAARLLGRARDPGKASQTTAVLSSGGSPVLSAWLVRGPGAALGAALALLVDLVRQFFAGHPRHSGAREGVAL